MFLKGVFGVLLKFFLDVSFFAVVCLFSCLALLERLSKRVAWLGLGGGDRKAQGKRTKGWVLYIIW